MNSYDRMHSLLIETKKKSEHEATKAFERQSSNVLSQSSRAKKKEAEADKIEKEAGTGKFHRRSTYPHTKTPDWPWAGRRARALRKDARWLKKKSKENMKKAKGTLNVAPLDTSKFEEMNSYDRIYNILIEAASFGGSPSRTGHRVGAAMAELKTKLGAGSDEYQKKQVQARRIQQKTATRQEGFWPRHSRNEKVAGDNARSRFAKNYEAGKKKDQGVDSRGKKVTAGDPGKGAHPNL